MRYLIPVLVLLAGCTVTPEQQAAERRARVQAIVAEYGPACETLGHKPGTAPYGDCVIQLYSAEQQRRGAAAAAFGAAQKGFEQASEPFGY